MLTKRLLAGASAAAIAATGLILTTRAADAATNYAVAPYVDLSAGSADFLDTAITQGHLTAFTAAFVIASGCTPIWGDTLTPGNSTVDPRISRAKSEGAQPIISFGGAGGVELGQGCTNQSSLQAAYQSVITHYGINHVDFDIEGAAIADTASVDRRFKAIKGLENANPGLNVSVTIPVLESGPDTWGKAFLANAASNGVRLDIINAMAMDYGHPNADMAGAAETAAAGTLAAARAAGLNVSYANIGITPMIGQNDTAGDVVSQANAQTIVNWAHANGIGRLAFWSVGRDQPCAGGGVSPNCSGLGGSPLDFTKIFNAGGGGTGPTTQPTTPPTTRPTTPPTTKPTTPPASGTTWVANHAYKIGDVVTYNGVSYRCIQSHTSLTGWEPPNVPALWQRL
ncbi:carbohydrate-binding protein [Actinoplanes sp. NPDC051343]|jgi:chitinase|uniref:carbohydrate-binding protein n=1 Tax=Actinoplanes sp. NPDC051343 TaxID=3363906 RepID=UPI0037B9BCCB